MTAYQLFFSQLYVNYVRKSNICFLWLWGIFFRILPHLVSKVTTGSLKNIKFQGVLHLFRIYIVWGSSVCITISVSSLYRQGLPKRRGNLKYCCKEIFNADVVWRCPSSFSYLDFGEKENKQTNKAMEKCGDARADRWKQNGTVTTSQNLRKTALFSGPFLYVRYKETPASLIHSHLSVSY